MRKILLKAIIVGTSMLLLSGCNSKDVAITADKADSNEIIITSTKKVQSVIKESFNKKYYKEKALKTFIEEDLEHFNSSKGTNIKLNLMKVKKGNVYVVLDYKSIDEYNEYNEYQVVKMDGNVAKDSSIVPSKLEIYGKNKKESKKNALDKGMNVLVIQPKIEIEEELPEEDFENVEEDENTEEDTENPESEDATEEDVESKKEELEKAVDLKVNLKLTVAGKIKYTLNAKKDDKNTAKISSLSDPVIIVYE